MEHQQPKATDPAAFRRVWNRVSAANGSSQVVPQSGASAAKPTGSATPPSAPPNPEDPSISFLRTQILAALVTHRTAARLASEGRCVPVLRSVAMESLYAARRLSTALFLRTGERYFPTQEGQALPLSNWPEGMRLLFLRTSQAGAALRRAAQGSQDPSLAQLLHTLAKEAELHALRIQTALERWG